MNWGHKITIAIIAFMSFILYMVVQASMKSVDLEAADYYNQGISYQELMEAMKNAYGLEEKYIISQDANNLVVEYPHELVGKPLEGTLHFFKPDNSKLDKKTEMKVNEGKQLIPLNTLSKGVYVLKVNWTSNGKEYYVEKSLNIQ